MPEAETVTFRDRGPRGVCSIRAAAERREPPREKVRSGSFTTSRKDDRLARYYHRRTVSAQSAMSNEAREWVYEHSRATGNDRLVLLRIAEQASKTGENSWPGRDLIMRHCGITCRKTFRRIIRRLESIGELIVFENQGGNGNTPADKRPNRYDMPLVPGYRYPQHLTPRLREGGILTRPGGAFCPPRGGHGAPPIPTDTSLIRKNIPQCEQEGPVENPGGNVDNQQPLTPLGELGALAIDGIGWCRHATVGDLETIGAALVARAGEERHPPSTLARAMRLALDETRPPDDLRHLARYVASRIARRPIDPPNPLTGWQPPPPVDDGPRTRAGAKAGVAQARALLMEARRAS